MVIQPIYNILFLPDVTYHFKKEFFTENASEQLEVGSELLFAFLRNEDDAEELDADHICPVGISARVEAFGDDDSVQIRTLERVDLSDVEVENGQILADASIRAEVDDYTAEEEKAQFLRLRAALLKFVQGYQWGMWARSFILQRKNMYDLGSALSEYLNISPEEKYAIVETDSRRERCTLIEAAINEFMEVAKVSTEAKEAQKDDQEQLYREAAIKKQISYLQKELDELHPENISDTRKFEKKIEESGMNDEARKEAEKVLNRMKQEGKDSHEYGLLYDYLDFMTSLDWKAPQFTPIDLDRAEQILDEDHYGLKKVKERIIQQLAVMALNRKQYGSILLFVGAPGTGKTSIGQSIARALGREYVRISLGGIRDEAEIRGHRRTYIGAMPGRIIKSLIKAGASNPVFILDEIDKVSADRQGDPSSALLEVLDPEQNTSFHDNFLDVDYDLSKVLFIATANNLNTIPGPLLDGLGMTVRIALFGLALAVAAGLGAALLRLSPWPVARGMAHVYVGCLRNTPLLLQLFFVYFLFAPAIGVGPFGAAVLALGLFEGAYMAELFRAGLQSVPRAQWEAGISLGLGVWNTLRLVILPQAVRRMLPPLTSQLVSLIKDTSLVSAIAVADLTMQAQVLIADTFLAFEIWLIVAALYLALTLCVALPARWMERRYAWR